MTDSFTPSQQNLLIDLIRQHMLEELTQGQLLKYLRKQFLHMNQGQFAVLVGVSRRTLSDLEQDKGSPAQAIVNKVFAPFGIKTSLAPADPMLACYLFVGKGQSQ
ncbi:helix-turn-helix domain-containing protein [Marinomonas sp. THO17]|uniref:helix-turn-helix domain-containing protein n=1 Tax=Marinomonas sp. THO17 TaxID=3149048 RepID=UPI00336BBBDB